MNGTFEWTLWPTLGLFLASAAMILAMGSRLTRVADRLADNTGFGEAMFGAVLLGGTTSLPGIVTSVTAAATGHPQLAVSNAVGGIVAQTAMLAIADMMYRKVNLEHAAASAENLINGALLCALLGLVLLAASGPDSHVWSIHPASILLLLGYALGVRLASQTHDKPAWKPEMTEHTRIDEPELEQTRAPSSAIDWLSFAALALGVAVVGYLVAGSGITIARLTGLSESIVGGLLTAVATSLPELVTSIAAVRQGALTLAVGTIIGGNTFDVLFVAFSDIAYRPGSIYHAIDREPLFVISLAIVLTGILLLGLLHREKHGIGNIGFESALILVLYLGGFLVLGFGFP